jgi:hypothetical protein
MPLPGNETEIGHPACNKKSRSGQNGTIVTLARDFLMATQDLIIDKTALIKAALLIGFY